MHFNWKIGGEAGFGIMTSGLVFSKIATRSGYHIFDYTEYPSLIRGGHNTYEVHVSHQPVASPLWHIDLLVCLNKDTYHLHKHRLTKKSMVMYDPDMFVPEDDHVSIAIPFKTIQKEQKIRPNMLNTVAVAASVAVLGAQLDMYEDIIHQQFDKKGTEVVELNSKLAKLGYDYATKHNKATSILSPKKDISKQLVMTGNESFCLAATAADCRYYAAYPMTPASSILTTLAAMQYTNKMVVRHPEDEISVANSALGAAFAGVRSAVGTSGGGFALMVEALSYAGIAEIPLVVFLAMRSGPATGMPTWTEQGDLLFAVHAGHGEFPKIVLTPGDAGEMFQLTQKAFDLADIYQTPVIIASDKFLSESHTSVPLSDIEKWQKEHKPHRGKIVSSTNQKKYLRYQTADDGISPMLIPGKKGIFYQANSYEHLEDSHTTENADERIKQVNKRNAKQTTYLKNHFEPPQVFGDAMGASGAVGCGRVRSGGNGSNVGGNGSIGTTVPTVVLVSYGSNKGPILDAMKLVKSSVVYIHFTHVFPLDEQSVQKVFKPYEGKRIVLVENNAHAQFAKLLRMHTGITITETLLKYDGRPFWPEEIASYIQKKDKSSITKDARPPNRRELKMNNEQIRDAIDHAQKKKALMDTLAREMA